VGLSGKPEGNLLGISEDKETVWLYTFDPQNNQAYRHRSLEKGKFRTVRQRVFFKKNNGKPEDLSLCRSFRFFTLNNERVVSYEKGVGKKRTVVFAKTDNSILWTVFAATTKLSGATIALTTTLPQDTVGALFVFGGSRLGIAKTKTLKRWSVVDSAFFGESSPKTFRSPLGVNVTNKGILIVYNELTEKENVYDLKIGAFMVSLAHPDHIIWKDDDFLWHKEIQKTNTHNVEILGCAFSETEIFSYITTGKNKVSLLRLSYPFSSPHKRGQAVTPLKKPKHNPVIAPQENEWEAQATFNAAAIQLDGKTHLLYRAIGNDGVSRLGYAQSENGKNIDERFKKPAYSPQKTSGRDRTFFYPYMSGGSSEGVEDPRLVHIDDSVYMTYTSFNGSEAPRVAITSIESKNFLEKNWKWKKPQTISSPGEIHKNWVLFPRKIHGKFAILHSISPEILIDYFDTLDFEKDFYIESYHTGKSPSGFWHNRVRGAGPPPIETEMGWLVLYHATDRHEPWKYKIGAMLLDKEDPTKILHRSLEPILEPDQEYENSGLKGGVVYACGATVRNGILHVYYGGADTVLCVATAPLSVFLEMLSHNHSPRMSFSPVAFSV